MNVFGAAEVGLVPTGSRGLSPLLTSPRVGLTFKQQKELLIYALSWRLKGRFR